MKRTLWMAVGALLLLGFSMAAAQSLGDVARSVRKGKAQQNTASRQYDNDNLPKDDHLSVVGPAPAADANTAAQSGDANAQSQAASSSSTEATAPDPKAAAAERQKVADEWQKKIEDQKKKIDSLNHELDLTEREYRLRAAAMYGDVGNRMRNAAQWDKEDADYKQQIGDKQKAVDAAKQELENLQEQARKAGVKEQ